MIITENLKQISKNDTMKNISRNFKFNDVWDYISSDRNEPFANQLKEALVYWERQNNFIKLMDMVFPDQEFFLGEMIDLDSLNTLNLGFERNFYKDFDDIFEIERKSYVADNKENASFEILISYELKRVNH